MKKFILFIWLIFLVLNAVSQEDSIFLVDYHPAPGQHINVENIGTPQAAAKMSQNFSSMVSLGSFGGQIILQFKNACVNHPDNPFGIDFTIFGNAFAGSSEPGIVWVMKDENRNRQADDTWYEIAGSNHFFSGTVRNYSVSYFKTSSRNIVWKDNFSKTGLIAANDFYFQSYYPDPEYFPGYPADSVTFTGTLLENNFIKNVAGEIRLDAPAFGYADCHPFLQGADRNSPDNPYTPAKEGAGGNPVDISWAIGGDGNYIELDSVHFVKVVSASLDEAGWLGEISTDIAWVQKVKPQPGVSGKNKLLVLKHHPVKITAGDSMILEAVYFEQGKRSLTPVSFQSVDESVAVVDEAGKLTAVRPGVSQIHFSAATESDYTSIHVVIPESIRFTTDFSTVYPGDTLELNTEVYDNEKDVLYRVPEFSVSDPSIAKIIESEGKLFLIALRSGEATLTASLDEFQVSLRVPVKILSHSDVIKILLTVKTRDENLLPLQWVDVGLGNLNSLVENRQHEYATAEKITLFHALAAGLHKTGATTRFRDDDTAGGNLYLYQVEKDGLFFYGWGGKTNPAAYARAWIARLNNNQYLNSFDDIQVADGDTVVLYHVPDILNPWSYSRLISTRNSAGANREAEVLLEQTTCILQGGKVLESGFTPVANAAVYADGIYYTDGSGKVNFEAENNLIVSSGNNALLINTDNITMAGVVQQIFRVYPNPVIDYLTLEMKAFETTRPLKLQVRLVNLTGSTVLEEEIKSFPVRFDLSFLPSGVYHLVVCENQNSKIHKLVKQ